MTKSVTEELRLPEPEHYRKMHVEPGIDHGTRWMVRAGPCLGSLVRGVTRRRLVVFLTDDKEEAKRVAAEMQKRLDVARKLLGLPVSTDGTSV